jgi:hypothetical protein
VAGASRHRVVAGEIELMTQTGMTPQAVAKSSTRKAADFLIVKIRTSSKL